MGGDGGYAKGLGGDHHQEARRITGVTAKFGVGWEWEYPLVVTAMESTGLHPIRYYIKRLQATIAEKLAFHPIYKICVKAEWMPGTIRMVIWWDQDMVNILRDLTQYISSSSLNRGREVGDLIHTP